MAFIKVKIPFAAIMFGSFEFDLLHSYCCLESFQIFIKVLWIKTTLFSSFYCYYFSYSIHLSCRYKNTEHDASMSILDIGLPTGFTANTDDLNLVRAEKLTQAQAKNEANLIQHIWPFTLFRLDYVFV